jgi:hypothetical protein
MASLTVSTCAPNGWCSIPVWDSTQARILNDSQKGYTPTSGEIMYVRDKRRVAIYNGDFWSV